MTDEYKKSFFELMQDQNIDDLYRTKSNVDWDRLAVERKVHEQSQKEITADLKKIGERSAYQEKEAKTLVRDIAGTVVDKDQRRKNINMELQRTTDKDKKLRLLENHHQLTRDIEKFWEDKSKRWEAGMADINKTKK